MIHSQSARPGGTFTVSVVITGLRIRVEAEDSGGPWAPRLTGDPERGRGLEIVEQLAAGWGVRDGDPDQRTIWCEIAQLA